MNTHIENAPSPLHITFLFIIYLLAAFEIKAIFVRLFYKRSPNKGYIWLWRYAFLGAKCPINVIQCTYWTYKAQRNTLMVNVDDNKDGIWLNLMIQNTNQKKCWLCPNILIKSNILSASTRKKKSKAQTRFVLFIYIFHLKFTARYMFVWITQES